MAIAGEEAKEILQKFRDQRDSLWENDFYKLIDWDERTFLDLLDDLYAKLNFVLSRELFFRDPKRIPFLVIFPVNNVKKLPKRLKLLGFSAEFNQILAAFLAKHKG